MKMNIYTKKQIKILEEINVVQHFLTATVSDYKRGTTSAQNETVAKIYEEATNSKVSRNFGCSSCCYRLYRDAGKLYYTSKNYYNRADEEKMRKAREAREKKNKEINENNDENKD